MRPIRIAICDDDLKEREFFYCLCKNFNDEKGLNMQVRQYASGDELLFHLSDPKIMHSVDILLLDISMPGSDGIEVANRLRECGFEGSIIFVTHSKQLAHLQSAFDAKALNYITKDDDVKKRFNRIFEDAVSEANKRHGKTLIFSSVSDARQINIADIIYFEIRDHLVTVYYNKNDYFEFISSLGKIENLLVGDDFIRVHRSYLISLTHIASVNMSDNSVTMVSGAVVPIGKKYKSALRESIKAQT